MKGKRTVEISNNICINNEIFSSMLYVPPGRVKDKIAYPISGLVSTQWVFWFPYSGEFSL